ncbi:ADL349Wp [Eremothecium gossypii ATCC 10895]|uniref:ADL349Wp n=1 Tax=Eremothecium gossypii (strain ATCC 10895 / CBS 109.51 / FGSC 9923 / NRRL Y-1056) TaxID=284811 RepID=Q75BB6_EREGS|nr:ADL349Wp [Eremothecium gossypii ATCC 10895]AAS51570.1 ADL349Wp [Eremothecium gossypii ATCC 10895]AEY95867.1 FADL349Wp [Eremothecium gossypii FDAG1]
MQPDELSTCKSQEESNPSDSRELEHTEEDEDDENFYDFRLFISQLRDSRAEPILKYTKSFLQGFVSNRTMWSASEQVKLLNDYKLFVYDKYAQYEPFRSLGPTKLRNAKEGMEKLLMGKLYMRCFSPCIGLPAERLDPEHAADLEQDEQLKAKIAEYRFLAPEHLEIPDTLSPKLSRFVDLSVAELAKINQYKAPRDKIVCILNACKIIFGLLKHSRLEHGGADVFVPLLIYTVLKSDVSALASNLRYIERFRLPAFLHGESAYYLSSLQGAVGYILHLDPEKLHIPDPVAYNALYDANRLSLPAPPLEEAPRAPADYILRPLDGAASTVFSLFTDFLSPKNEKPPDADVDEIDDPTTTELIRKLEHQEHREMLQNLQGMFPDLDPGLIHDVCIATRYRMGACVDSLLSISD